MENLKIFNHPKFGKVRTVMPENGNVLFCATDVASSLGYKSPKDAVLLHYKTGKSVYCPHANGVYYVRNLIQKKYAV